MAKESVAERVARLAGGVPAVVPEKPARNQRIKKDGTPDKRANNKGHEGKAGRKPLEEQRRTQFQLVRDFADKEVTVREIDRKTGKTRDRKMTVLSATLEVLYSEVQKRQGWAVHEMLDRILGKAAQPVTGDEDQPIVVKIDF